jgi:PIN domain nuclease of toxin-antitoxin system
MKAYLLDTNVLVYATASPAKLGRTARRIIDTAGTSSRTARLCASTMSLHEVWLLERAGKIRLSVSLGLWHQRLETYGIAFEPILPADVLSARALDWDHRDVADRLIVATAQRLGVPVVTSDRAIREWSGIETLW